MKRKTIIFLIWTICLILSACSPTSAPTEITHPATETAIPPTPTETPTPLPPMVTAQEQVNCYSGPGEDGYVLVAAIESGTQMDVVGKDASGKYWIVMDPKSNKGCWVDSQHTTQQGNTQTLPILIPAPKVATRPNAPGNVNITYKCTKTRLANYTRSQTILFEISFTITWEDKSDNEAGFEIYKNDNLLKTVDANTTTTIDVLQKNGPLYGSASYKILAFNDEGKSIRVEKSVQYACQ